jgi:hypothetical protein
MKNVIKIFSIAGVCVLLAYSIVGWPFNKVEEIKREAPVDMSERGWKILRYEGFQWGAFSTHNGKVWYHVAATNNPNVQYRVVVTKWGNELQYYYGAPETLTRIELVK